MSNKLQVFEAPVFDQSIVKEEERTYHPHVKSFDYNDEVEIEIHQQDGFIAMSDSLLCISAEMIPEVGEEAYVPGTCKLSNNAGLHLFNSISYEFNGKEIEKVRDPGITTTLRALTTYSANEAKNLALAGWGFNSENPVTTTDGEKKKFWLWIPFSFIFSLFHYYKNVMYGRHKIRLVRSRTDNNAYVSTNGTTRATIKIHDIAVKVKHIFPNDELKLKMLQLLKSNKPITIGFRKFELFELPGLNTGTDKTIWNLKTTTNIETPRSGVLAFQTDIKDNFTKDISQFNHINIRNYHFWLGSSVFPHESWDLNFANKQYLPPYQAYIDLLKENTGNAAAEPMIDYTTFGNTTTLFPLDFSRQEEPLTSSTVDIKVDFQSRGNFADRTKAYCLINYDKLIEYRPLTGIVRELV